MKDAQPLEGKLKEFMDSATGDTTLHFDVMLIFSNALKHSIEARIFAVLNSEILSMMRYLLFFSPSIILSINKQMYSINSINNLSTE